MNDKSGMFRPEIQGLRAVSILMVLIYHAFPSALPGGFFGVDVFFVLSGYLITQVLLRQQEQYGRVKLLRFWGQRIRRLLPNACLTLAAIAITAHFLVPAYRIGSILTDIAAATFYYVNFHFAGTAVDYFNIGASESPVLHFWSLAVEEQFYLVWPLLILAIGLLGGRFARRLLIIALVTIAIASFAFCLHAMTRSQPLAFFHPAARGWELAVGALVAVLDGRLAARLAPWRTAVVSAGLGLIFLAACFAGGAIAHPGPVTLLPVVGASLILAAGKADTVSPVSPETWLLRKRPARAIGDISYSLYLWHWPVLVFAAALYPDQPLAVVVAIALSFVLAIAAYVLVEQPLHKGRFSATLPAQAGIALAAIGLVAASTSVTTGRVPPANATVDWQHELDEARADLPKTYAEGCHLDLEQIEQPQCLYGDAGSEHVAILYGDSHAAQWFPALEIAAKAAGWGLHSWTKSSCPSVPVNIWYAPMRRWFNECTEWRDQTFERLLAGSQRYVVFISNSVEYFRQSLMDAQHQSVLNEADARSIWSQATASLIERLTARGHRVVLIRDTPRQHANYADCLVLDAVPTSCGSIASSALPALESNLPSGMDVTLLDLSASICNDDICPLTAGDRLIYRDSDHLNATFAASLAPAFSPFFALP